MSYQEKSITVSLFSFSLLLIYFISRWLEMYRNQGLDPAVIYALWVTVIVAGILINILANILTNIVLSIVHAIRTGSEESERFIADERDRLIDLKGERVAYVAFSIGVLIAMLSFVFGQPALVMFSLLIFCSLASQIVGNIAQIVLYRRGF